ncbi:MAG: hypothetical protein ACYS47_02550 [Planctomycetota bacterium]|jgi:hypothetical protein
MGRRISFDKVLRAMNERVAAFFDSLSSAAEHTAERRLLGSMASESLAQRISARTDAQTDTEVLNLAFSRVGGLFPLLVEGSLVRYRELVRTEAGIVRLAILMRKAGILFLRELSSLAASSRLRTRVAETIETETEHLDQLHLLLLIERGDVLPIPC